jgi:hypothetical protein
MLGELLCISSVTLRFEMAHYTSTGVIVSSAAELYGVVVTTTEMYGETFISTTELHGVRAGTTTGLYGVMSALRLKYMV